MRYLTCPYRSLGILLGLAVLLFVSPQALQAQAAANKDDKSEAARFDTVDYVDLQGTFYPSMRGRKGATALLLHKLGGDSHQDGWDNLAKALHAKGFAVLSFDFRGHGNSKSIQKDFWKYPFNQSLHSFKPTNLKDTITYKDFPPAYLPYLVNDIAAAKAYLDRKNDAGECNSSAIILIGAEDGATLGSLWMGAEWYRYRVTSPFPLRVERNAEGKDVYGAIWLSLSPSLANRNTVTSQVRNAIQMAGREKKTPMAFVYGADDRRGEQVANYYLQTIIRDKDDKASMPLTNKKAIDKTKLTGSALLKDGLDTEKWIVETYLSEVMDKNPPTDWIRRDPESNSFVWQFPNVQPVIAKEEKAKMVNPIPLQLLGLGR